MKERRAADGRGSSRALFDQYVSNMTYGRYGDDSIPLDFVLFEELHRTIAQVAVAEFLEWVDGQL